MCSAERAAYGEFCPMISLVGVTRLTIALLPAFGCAAGGIGAGESEVAEGTAVAGNAGVPKGASQHIASWIDWTPGESGVSPELERMMSVAVGAVAAAMHQNDLSPDLRVHLILAPPNDPVASQVGVDRCPSGSSLISHLDEGVTPLPLLVAQVLGLRFVGRCRHWGASGEGSDPVHFAYHVFAGASQSAGQAVSALAFAALWADAHLRPHREASTSDGLRVAVCQAMSQRLAGDIARALAAVACDGQPQSSIEPGVALCESTRLIGPELRAMLEAAWQFQQGSVNFNACPSASDRPVAAIDSGAGVGSGAERDLDEGAPPTPRAV